jgi:hypothetical protein
MDNIDDTYRLLKRIPFEQLEDMVTINPVTFGPRMPVHRVKKYLEESGWTREEYIKEFNKRNKSSWQITE